MFDKYKIYSEYHRNMESAKWTEEIPFLDFPKEWKIKITPPRGGAVVRFQVRIKGANVSVYLDCYEILGYGGGPYWEVYPYDGDVYRCGIQDTEKLITAITRSIQEQNQPQEK